MYISSDITGHWLWHDAERLRWWFDLLFLAECEDRQVMHDANLIDLQRGQLIASVSMLAKRWNKRRPTIAKYMSRLESEGLIKCDKNYRYANIITIVNFDVYQSLIHDTSTPVGKLINTFTCKLYTLKSTLNDCKSSTLMCTNENELYTLAYTLVNSLFDTLIDILNGDLSGYNSDTLKDEGNNGIYTLINTSLYTLAKERKQKRKEPKEKNKEIKIYNNNNNNAREEKKILDQLKQTESYVELIAMRFHLTADEVKERLDAFGVECLCVNHQHTDFDDARKHFYYWLEKKLIAERKNQTDNAGTTTDNQDRRRGTDITATRWQDYEGAF